MYHLNGKFSIKRKIKYVFFITLMCWILLGVFVAYQFFLKTTKKTIKKGGTFVEGIFDTTSFLPYLDNDRQSKFYQGMLYKSCMKSEYLSGKIVFTDDLCHVTTKNYETYFVSLETGSIRSDGVPLTIDDVFFTYNDVLSYNTWNINSLKKYKDIKVSKTENNKVKIEFPEPSIDNNLFFSNYILPRHALIDSSLIEYQKDFSIEPIYSNCAHILPQTSDKYSLVFDLSDCFDTHLGYYQIKNTINFENFEHSVKVNQSIIDVYEHKNQLSGYSKIDLKTNNYVSLFFNTNSKKLRIRPRRALGGLILNNFFTGKYNKYFSKNDMSLFNGSLSTGGNISEFLGRTNSNQVLSKGDLEDIGVKQLPENIFISGNKEKLVYYAENINNLFSIYFKFKEKYDKISINHGNNGGYIPKSYDKNKKTAKYNISPNLNNLDPGLNKYEIYGYQDKKKELIASINLYNLKGGNIRADDVANFDPEERLTIIYYREPNSIFIVEQLQKIFQKYGILEWFIFQGVEDPNELEGRLIMGDYEIVINSINMGYKKDISLLFKIDDPVINHSQYTNEKFVNLLKQYYTAKDKSKLKKQINEIYLQDMPFIILGKSYKSLFVKDKMMDKIPFKDNNLYLYENNRRENVYKNLSLVENVNIDMKNSGGTKEFIKFIKSELKN